MSGLALTREAFLRLVRASDEAVRRAEAAQRAVDVVDHNERIYRLRLEAHERQLAAQAAGVWITHEREVALASSFGARLRWLLFGQLPIVRMPARPAPVEETAPAEPAEPVRKPDVIDAIDAAATVDAGMAEQGQEV